MRKALILVPFLAILWPELVQAQETYSLPASAGNVVTLNEVITFYNGETCARYSLALTCTQAQACTSAVAPGGASCTAAQARNAGVRIYALTQAGREEFVTFVIAAPEFFRLADSVQKAAQRKLFCDAWAVASGANQGTCRTAISAPANSNPCQ